MNASSVTCGACLRTPLSQSCDNWFISSIPCPVFKLCLTVLCRCAGICMMVAGSIWCAWHPGNILLSFLQSEYCDRYMRRSWCSSLTLSGFASLHFLTNAFALSVFSAYHFLQYAFVFSRLASRHFLVDTFFLSGLVSFHFLEAAFASSRCASQYFLTAAFALAGFSACHLLTDAFASSRCVSR